MANVERALRCRGGRVRRLPAVAVPVGFALGLAAPPAASPPAPELRIERVDLGTLGGTDSEATAVEGSLVTGWTYTETGDAAAFVSDLGQARPAMRSLGTFPGGRDSRASAVRDGVVVGTASLPGGSAHAFAYDLRAASPRMIDLGTLGGRFSDATATADGLVVGDSGRSDGTTHAFAYDLRAMSPRMIDLGSLGGSSYARAVDDGVVVGFSLLSVDVFMTRAFAYDVRAARPHLRDLGTLGGRQSSATAIAGRMVTGSADTAAGRSEAFDLDLGRPHPSMVSLGTLGGARSGARARTRSVIVGDSNRRHDDAGPGSLTPTRREDPHAFVYDASGARAMVDLGALDGTDSSASAVSDRLVGGTWTIESGTRGFVYCLDTPGEGPFDLGYRAFVNDVSDTVVVGHVNVTEGRMRAVAWRVKRAPRRRGGNQLSASAGVAAGVSGRRT